MFKKLFGSKGRSSNLQTDQESLTTAFNAMATSLSKIRKSDSITNWLIANRLYSRTENIEVTDLLTNLNKTGENLQTEDNEPSVEVSLKEFDISLREALVEQPLDIPYFTSMLRKSVVGIRFGKLDSATRNAIRGNYASLVLQVALYKTYPVLCIAPIIYDKVRSPLVLEGFLEIDSGNVQDFLKVTIANGWGEIHCYSEDGELQEIGKFTLQAPDTYVTTKGEHPISPSSNYDKMVSIMVVKAALAHYESIPKYARDFSTATDLHMRSVRAFKIFGKDGIKSK